MVKYMSEERNSKIRLWIWRGLAIVVVVVFFVVQHMLRDKITVRAAVAQRQHLQSTVSTNGHVEPVGSDEYFSPTTSTVKAVLVQAGDHVKAGQLLMQLDDVSARAKVATAESGLKAALASLDAAEHNGTLEQRQATGGEITRLKLERDGARRDVAALKRLQAAGAASQSEVNAAEQRLATAEAMLGAQQQTASQRYSTAEVERARAAVADAQAARTAAQEMLAQTALKARIDGTVYAVHVRKGDYAEEGKTLLQLADLHHEQIRAYFDEVDVARLTNNQNILIKWDAQPGKEWHGHILRAPTSVTAYGTRNVGEVLISIEDQDGSLLPDTNVNVTATTSSDSNALSVPRQSIMAESGKPFVFKVVGNSLVRTPVTTGIRTADSVAVLTGLNEGDVVATGSLSGHPLQEGVPVKVVR